MTPKVTQDSPKLREIAANVHRKGPAIASKELRVATGGEEVSREGEQAMMDNTSEAEGS